MTTPVGDAVYTVGGLPPETRERTVVDGVLMRTSPTAMQKHRDCPRAWYYRYVEHLPDKPPSAGLKRGKEGHERLKHYYATGQDILDPLEHLALDRGVLPRAGTPGIANAPAFRLASRFGVPVIGEIDLIIVDSPVRWRLIDFKFKKSIEKWGSTAQSLTDPTASEGIQMLTYAAAIRQGLIVGNAPPLEVQVEHLTFQTVGRRDVKQTSTLIDLDLAFDRWQRGVESQIPELQKTASQTSAFEVFGNEKHCRAYGGCAYLEQCYDPLVRLKASLKGIDEGVALKGLKSKHEEETMGLLGKKLENIAAAPPAETRTISVLPPDQPPTPKPANFVQVAGPTPAMTSRIIIEGDTGPIPPKALTPETPLAAAPAEDVEAPAKRGRKPKSAPTPTASSPVPAPEAVPLPLPLPIGEQYTAPEARANGVRLFFDCAPVGAKTVPFTPIVQQLNDQVIAAAGLKVDDLRQCTDNIFGFNKWKPYLTAHAVDTFKAGKIPPADYVILDGDERTRCVAEALGMHLPAGNVVVAVGR